MGIPKRVTGFMPLAKEVLDAEPGLTAQEIFPRVVQLAERRGIQISAASDPQASLVATLHKVYRDFGLVRVADKARRYRYYPEDQAPHDTTLVVPRLHDIVKEQPQVMVVDPPKGDSPSTGPGCCIHLSTADSKRIRALVDLGRYSNEHEAHSDLVKKGLESFLSKLDNMG